MQIEIGTILEGKVTAIKEYGAFVALAPDYKKSGMVHISEISGQYVEKIEHVLSVGQNVRVKVLSIDEKGKVALSIKAVEPPPEKKAPQKKSVAQAPCVSTAPPPVYTVYTQPKPQKGEEKDPFEEMMSRFKSRSDEKISDLRKNVDQRRGGGYSRRGNKKF